MKFQIGDYLYMTLDDDGIPMMVNRINGTYTDRYGNDGYYLSEYGMSFARFVDSHCHLLTSMFKD